MNSTLVLAACALALATTAGAQTGVTISGYVDASVLLESGGAAGSLRKVGSGVSGPTRLIIRGTEDLGGGLTVGFHLEHGLLVDTGASLQQNFWGRQSFLQITGALGSLQGGLVYMPLFSTLRDVADPFRASFAGNAGNIFTAGFPAGPKSVGFPNASAITGTVSTGAISRANTLLYSLPKLAGFTGELAYSLGEQASASNRLKTVGGSLGYAQGALTVRLAASKTYNAAASDTERNALLGANYDFGALRLYLGAGSNRGYSSKRSEDALIGASSRVGPVTLMASYARKNDKSPANVDASQVGLGAMYHLSRRTHLHASFAKISNDVPNTSPAFYTVSSPAGPGTGDRMFGVGIGHFF